MIFSLRSLGNFKIIASTSLFIVILCWALKSILAVPTTVASEIARILI